MSSLVAFGVATNHLESLLCQPNDTTVPCIIPALAKLPEAPSYGILMELLEFAESKGSSKACHVNKIFKQLIDTLFPGCSVSRADRLMRRIRKLLNPIDLWRFVIILCIIHSSDHIGTRGQQYLNTAII